MSVFSDLDVQQAMRNDQIIIEPFIPENLNGSSYDVTLGHHFWVTEHMENRDYFNPFDEDDCKRYFKGPYVAMEHGHWCEKFKKHLFKGIPENHPIIVLRPGERILGHTHEFIGIKAPGTTEMQARSTWGRNAITVCYDAGWGDPNFINRWTMEIRNNNQHESVPLPVGERMAQIVFHATGPVKKGYGGDSSKYQAGLDLSKIKADWKPEAMLPRAYKDARLMPRPIEGLNPSFK